MSTKCLTLFIENLCPIFTRAVMSELGTLRNLWLAILIVTCVTASVTNE